MKKMFIAAFLIAALAACGGKKKADPTTPGSGSAPAAGSDSGSAAPADGSGSAAPAEGGGGM